MKKVYVIAAILAILTSFSIYRFAVYLSDASKPAERPKTTVLVAAADIPAGTLIESDMLEEMQVYAEYKLEGVCTMTADAIGKLSADTIYKGEQILFQKLIASGSAVGDRLSYELGDGQVAYSVAVSDTRQRVSGYVKEGDLVTLVINEPEYDSEGEFVADHYSVFRQDVYVIRVGASSARDSLGYTEYTFRLTRDEALAFVPYQSNFVILLQSAFDGLGEIEGALTTGTGTGSATEPVTEPVTEALTDFVTEAATGVVTEAATEAATASAN